MLNLSESTFPYLTLWWSYKYSTLPLSSWILLFYVPNLWPFLSCIRQPESYICETQRGGVVQLTLSNVLINFSKTGNFMILLKCSFSQKSFLCLLLASPSPFHMLWAVHSLSPWIQNNFRLMSFSLQAENFDGG